MVIPSLQHQRCYSSHCEGDVVVICYTVEGTRNLINQVFYFLVLS